MENNDQRQNKSFWKSKSIIGTFALAIIAVVAIVIVGLNQTSYAIPEVDNLLPDEFTTATPGEEVLSDTGFVVFPYKTTEGITVFCLERNIDFAANTTYNKGAAIEDNGLLYLLAETSSDINIIDYMYDEEISDAVKTWVSQVSIWVYLNKIGAENNSLSDDDLQKIMNAKTIYTNSVSSGYKADGTKVDLLENPVTTDDDTFYERWVEPLVDEAMSVRQLSNKTVKINKGDTVSLTSDDKYYQSSAISVVGSPSDYFVSFALKLESAPEGTIVVDANGTKIDEEFLSYMFPGEKFYIRVPVDKVTEENKDIKFSVTGTFESYEGNYYVAANAQTIASVDSSYVDVQTGAQFSLNYTPDVPDTGLSTAQTVYFIGLIVLLSGIGIVYANVKPSESK